MSLKRLSVLCCFVTLVSCGGDEATIQNNTPNNNLNDSLKEYKIPEEQLLEDRESMTNVLESFPKKWVRVEVTGDEHICKKPCAIEMPGLEIVKEENYYRLRTIYGDDFEDWELINMTAEYTSAENQDLQNGIFVVRKITYPDEELYEVDYFWNKTKNFCSFGEFFHKKLRFADAERMSEYKIVEEDCE